MSSSLPTAILRHETPDGSYHYDWMIARDPSATERLVTFRLDRRVDELASGARTTAERLPDHRQRYLHYEGPIGGDRGVVVRVARGNIDAGDPSGTQFRLTVRWAESGRSQTIALEVRDAPLWDLSVETAEDSVVDAVE